MKRLMRLVIIHFITFSYFALGQGIKQVEGSHLDWVQTGLKGLSVSGFGLSGGNLIAGALVVPTYPYGLIYISADKGITWTESDFFPINNKDTTCNCSLYAACTLTFITSGTKIFAGVGDAFGGNIYASTDNGITWSDTGIVWNENDTLLYHENINNFTTIGGRLFAGTNLGVFISIDSGKTWNSTDTSFTYQVWQITSLGKYIFAGTSGNGIYKSSDYGLNWSAIDSGLTTPYATSFTAIGNDLFAGFFPYNTLSGDSLGGVYLSTDNGVSWSVRDSGLLNHRVERLASNPNGEGGYNLYAATNVGLFFSNNYGNSWSQILIGTVVAIYISDSNLIVGTIGNGVWRLPLSELVTVVNDDLNKIPANFALDQNYPNPFNPSTTIKYQLPKTNFVTLKVYDILGRDVKTLVNEQQVAGTHSITFNAANLPSGVYFYRIIAGSFIQTKKLMVIK